MAPEVTQAREALESAVEGYGADESVPLGSYAALIAIFNAGLAGSLIAARLSGPRAPRPSGLERDRALRPRHAQPEQAPG